MFFLFLLLYIYTYIPMTLAIFIVQGDKGVKGKTGLEGVKVKKSKEEQTLLLHLFLLDIM